MSARPSGLGSGTAPSARGLGAARAGDRDCRRALRLQDDACDFYMQPHAHAVNAYAAGRRSIAVSAGLVTALGRGGITRDQAVAMLSHEVGHLLDHSTRYGLVTAWLTAPWRARAFVFGGLLRLIMRNMPTAKAALVLVPFCSSRPVCSPCNSRRGRRWPCWSPSLSF
jgi:Zn-dependent protease with chaperone function